MTMPDLNSGALAPVSEERSLFDLRVTGTLPKELSGQLLRNGPNPFSGRFAGDSVLDWWPEAAMLHAIEFRDGKAIAYRNRWAHTAGWANFNNKQNASDFPQTNPNVNVIHYADEILALAEGGLPVSITNQLETNTSSKLGQSFEQGVTAHPKLDATTGELRSFRSHWEAPFLTYLVHDHAANLRHQSHIPIDAPAMLHDMAITKNYSLLLDTPVGYDFSLFSKGMRIPVCWQAERESRIALIPRLGGEVNWLTVDPCFMQHVINAFETDDDRIMFDVMRYPDYFVLNSEQNGYDPNPLAVPWRYEIDLTTLRVSESPLSDVAMELPRINELLTGKRYRYTYAVAQPSEDEMRGICKLDTQTGALTTHEIPQGDQNSEPVFVGQSADQQEDNGWVLVCVYRHLSDTTDVLILDAKDIAAPPIATVHLPVRVPAGFHGAWIPG